MNYLQSIVDASIAMRSHGSHVECLLLRVVLACLLNTVTASRTFRVPTETFESCEHCVIARSFVTFVCMLFMQRLYKGAEWATIQPSFQQW